MIEQETVDAPGAERPLVIALDIGSSSVRAALHDRQGRPLAGSSVQVPYVWDIAPGGSVRLSHVRFLELVGDALDELATTVGSLATDVVAGGISCFLHSIVGLDDAHRPITPVLSWADTTSASEAAALRARTDSEAVHAETGAPIHAGYWPARMAQLRKEHPEIRTWAGLSDLIALEHTGRAVVSRSMASGTGLLDRSIGAWSEGFGAQLGIELDRLPEIVDDEEPIGRFLPTASRRWPAFAHIDWFAAWGDGACGNVGLGAEGRDTVALMIGTSGALRAVIPDPDPAIRAGLFAQRLGAGSVVGGQLSEGGGTIAWASRLLGRPAADLEGAAEEFEPAAHGLTVLPYVFGERSPGYHDDARGSVLGLSPETDAGAVYRAILESIAFGFATVDDQLSAVLGTSPAIVASGGALAHSPLLAQILADTLGRDIGVAPSDESSRRGAALLALRGAGLRDHLEAIPMGTLRRVHSDPARTARYQVARERRDALYQRILG